MNLMKLFTPVAFVLVFFFSSLSFGAQFEPSVLAQEIAKKVIYAKIYSNPSLSKMADLSGSKIEWRESPVKDLFYGVFWATYTFPDGQISRSPSRFYVKDSGVGSMVIVGTFVDSKGRSFDQDTVVPKSLGMAQKEVTNRVGGFPENPLTVVKKGKDRIIVFTDPDCPYCKKTLPELVALSKMENIQLEVLYTPIDSIHPNAREKSLVLLGLNPKDRLAAEFILEKIESGDSAVLRGVLAQRGLYSEKKYQDSAEDVLIYGEDIAARYGLRGTPNILIPSTMKAIQGTATASEIIEKLK